METWLKTRVRLRFEFKYTQIYLLSDTSKVLPEYGQLEKVVYTKESFFWKHSHVRSSLKLYRRSYILNKGVWIPVCISTEARQTADGVVCQSWIRTIRVAKVRSSEFSYSG